VALLLSALVALGLLLQQRRATFRHLREKIEPAVASAGSIILITAAGGAFGAMLAAGGVADEVREMANRWNISLILVGFLFASIMKAAQGSSTVAMITVGPVMADTIAKTSVLPCHPVYIALAIGAGAIIPSWMNDSAFWVVLRMGGLTEGETLKVWTVLTVVIGVVSILAVLALSTLIPFPVPV
jgi:GntP family gluconate:H+ symporter